MPNYRCCANCSKLRTDECKRPDECVTAGYKYWAKKPPWKVCPKCNGEMRRVRTEIITPDETVNIDVECQNCGYKGKLVQSFRSKKTGAPEGTPAE